MEPDFWHEKWQHNEIGFHESAPNPLLVNHFEELNLPPNGRILLPLCGKTLDISWLLARGVKVAGVELSQMAVDQLFSESGTVPEITQHGGISRYRAENIDIFQGDIFDLSRELLGPVDAIYDRAALVALPAPMRTRYSNHLMEITAVATQLLISFEYDQSQLDGPPFSIGRAEVARHYSDTYEISLLESKAVAGGLKGVCEATEHVWLLESRG